MDGLLRNGMEYSISSDGTAGYELVGDIPLWNEILGDPNRHPKQEVYEDEDSSESFNRALSRQYMANTNQQTFPTLISTNDKSHNAPWSLSMVADVTGLQCPNQPPVYATFDCHRLRTQQLLQQGKQHESFQRVTQSSVIIPPTQLPATMRSQICSHNPRRILQPTKANRERNEVRKEMQVLAKKFINRRMELGFSEETVSCELNNLCSKLNMAEIFSDKGIICFEMQNMTLEYMLKLKPMLDVWIEFTNPVRPYNRVPTTSLNALEKSFQQDSYPSSAEFHKLSKELNMDRKAVSNWFVHRRRKENKNKQITNTSNSVNSSTDKARKTRNCIPTTPLEVLEKSFQQNTMPNSEAIDKLSKELDMDKTAVYKWFANHRYREKKNKQISNTTNRGNSCSETTRRHHNRISTTSREEALHAIKAYKFPSIY